MKTLILTATFAAFAFTLVAPAQAAFVTDGINVLTQADSGIDKRRKPRVKGGSGCDDPEDVLEHPECR